MSQLCVAAAFRPSVLDSVGVVQPVPAARPVRSREDRSNGIKNRMSNQKDYFKAMHKLTKDSAEKP